MRTVTKWIMAATISAGAVACVGIVAAAAADVPVPYGQPAPPQEYYPPQQGYVYRQPPPAYVYPAPPPPVYRYYEAPVVEVVPPPAYYYYGPRYYGPRVAYGYYGRPWRHRHW